MITQRTWISRNRSGEGHAGSRCSPRLFGLCCLCGILLMACAGHAPPVAVSPPKPPVSILPPTPPPTVNDTGFLASDIASDAAEYIELGRESLNDSEWYDAAEYFDSAMVHLADLETDDSLSADIRSSAQSYQDSVREWLVQSVSQADKSGEAGDLSELLNQEIEEVPDSEVKDLSAELKGLPDRSFDLPLPSPLPEPVLQALRVFTGPGRGYFTRWLERRSRYDSLIDAKLVERNMPRDLIYLAMVESGFSSKAWSHKSASGLWQFVSGTGRRYGLKGDWWEDPRRDPVRSTDAALDYLQDLYTEFGDWHLVMAAYNWGEGHIQKQRDKNPDIGYWDMRLPEETRFYVPKILAAMIIGHNPAFFGFHPSETDPPLRFDTATVDRCFSLRGVAQVIGISEDSLKDLNPALRRWCTPPGRKSYTLCLPEGSRDEFYANYDRIDTVAVASWRRHIVERRETLASIADDYGLSVASIRAVNHLKSGRIHRGEALLLPIPNAVEGTGRVHVASMERYRVKRGESLYDIARRYQVSVYALRQANDLGNARLRAGRMLRIPDKTLAEEDDEEDAQPAPVAVSQTHHRIHVVARGETLYSISRKLGIKETDLQGWNGLHSDQVRLGQKLVYHSSGTIGKDAPGGMASSAGTAGAAGDLSDSSKLPGENSKVALASLDLAQYYQVKSGDNLWDISMHFGRSMSDLKKLNDNLPKTLRPGEKIRVR